VGLSPGRKPGPFLAPQQISGPTLGDHEPGFAPQELREVSTLTLVGDL
jgi:hypothetical protein